MDIELPAERTFVDVSGIRPVPDHQEVFLCQQLETKDAADCTVIVELLEHSTSSNPAEYFAALAQFVDFMRKSFYEKVMLLLSLRTLATPCLKISSLTGSLFNRIMQPAEKLHQQYC